MIRIVKSGLGRQAIAAAAGEARAIIGSTSTNS